MVNSIIPAIKVFTDDGQKIISLFDNIKIQTFDGITYSGNFLYMKLAQNENETDKLVLDISIEKVEITCTDIKDIFF